MRDRLTRCLTIAIATTSWVGAVGQVCAAEAPIQVGVFADSSGTVATLNAVWPLLETAYLVAHPTHPSNRTSRYELEGWSARVVPTCCPDSTFRILWVEPIVTAADQVERAGWNSTVRFARPLRLTPGRPRVLGTVRFLAPQAPFNDCRIMVAAATVEGTLAVGRKQLPAKTTPLTVLDGLQRERFLLGPGRRTYEASEGVYIRDGRVLEPPYRFVATDDTLWINGQLAWAEKPQGTITSCDPGPEAYRSTWVRPLDRFRVAMQRGLSPDAAISVLVETLRASQWVTRVGEPSACGVAFWQGDEMEEIMVSCETAAASREQLVEQRRKMVEDATGDGRAKGVIRMLCDHCCYAQRGWGWNLSFRTDEPELLLAELLAVQGGSIPLEGVHLQPSTLKELRPYLRIDR